MQRSWKKTIVISLLSVLMLVCGVFGACVTTTTPQETTYTVVYDSRGGAAVKDGKYTPSKTFNLPTPSIGTDPAMYGYTFTGWYYDTACSRKVDKKNVDVSVAKDGVLTFYAGWSNLHKIFFDTKTTEVIDSAEYAYGATVNVADLPAPSDRVVGKATCEFMHWARMNTNEAVTEDFTMDAVDVYLYAVYDTGVNSRFELDDEGYYVPTGTDSKTTQSRFRDYTLSDGQIYSVDMTLPADWSTYSDDSGPVFTATDFDEDGTTFNTGRYVTMFISAPKNSNGAIQFWGNIDDKDGNPSAGLQLLGTYNLDGSVLSGTPYAKKMAAYQESDEEETFTLTFRRVDSTADGETVATYYIGIDGIEYFKLVSGQKLEGATGSAGAASTSLIGNIVGLRAKTKAVKYSNIGVSSASKLKVTFDAGNGTVETESQEYEYGAALGELPTPVQEGYNFINWIYNDYKTNESHILSAEDVFDKSAYIINATAVWRKEGAKPFTVIFNTGIEGYTVDDVAGWYEGNALEVPALSYAMYEIDTVWYYDEACTKAVDLVRIDPEQGVVANAGTDEQTLTLYAKSVKKQFVDGEGTETSPYLVATKANLERLSELVASGETFTGMYVKLTADIDLENMDWTPIGSTTYPFKGTFDGNGKSITGLSVSGTSYLGLFGVISASTVKDLTIDGTVAGTAGAVGILAGQIQGGSTVSNVTTKGTVTAGGSDVGGIAGNVQGGTAAQVTISNCENQASVSCTLSSGNVAATGGIAGATQATFAVIIQNCVNKGSISSSKDFAGGIVGLLRINANTKVKDCYAYGNVTGGGKQAGGLVGGLRATLIDSYVCESVLVNGEAVTDIAFYGSAELYVGATAGRVEGGTLSGCTFCDENGNPIKVTVTFDADGGTASESTRQVNIFAKIGTLPTAERTGYIFRGWFVGETEIDQDYEVKANVTVKATWEEVQPTGITVTFDAGAGTLSGSATREVQPAAAIGELPTATAPNAGDVLVGWFETDGTQVTAQTVYNGITAITLTAKYGWDGTTVSASLGGEGTEASPYLIASGADLKYLANQVNGGEAYASKQFKLTASIELAKKAWAPIGGNGKPFKGTFNGNGKAITGLSVSGTTYLGLFGVISAATVKDLTVDGTVVGTAGMVGMLAGQIQGGSTVSNVTTKGTVTAGGSDVGGIAGNVQGGTAAQVTISNCENQASVSCTLSSGNVAATGGIAGATQATFAVIIQNCVNKGSISTGGNFAGGIVGLFRKHTSSLISECYNYGNISAKSIVGGIVGCNRSKVEKSYCCKDATIKLGSTEHLASTVTLVAAKESSSAMGAIIGQLDGGTIDTESGLCNSDGTAAE